MPFWAYLTPINYETEMIPIAARKPTHDYKVGDNILLINEIDLFSRHIGQSGVVQSIEKDYVTVKLTNGYRLKTFYQNLQHQEVD